MNSLRVLAVDDSPSFLQTMEEILRAENFTVTTADNVTSAWDQFLASSPDIVLLDLNLNHEVQNDNSGLSLTRAIKRHVQNKTWLPVILISSNAGVDDQLDGYQAGCDDYLAKPLDPRILIAKLTLYQRVLQFISGK